MRQNITITSLFLVALIGVGVASGTASPVMFGVGEATAPVTTTGIVATLTAIASAATGLWKLFQGGNVSSISDAVELLRPVLTGKTSLPEGTVRVALTVLEFDAVRRANTADYAAVQALARQFLFPTETK